MTGPCAKQRVFCALVTSSGERFIGENLCSNPQDKCPRQPGEGYDKCKTICGQLGHAEIVALALAGDKAIGSRAYIMGHSYACGDCQRALFAAGVRSFTVFDIEGDK